MQLVHAAQKGIKAVLIAGEGEENIAALCVRPGAVQIFKVAHVIEYAVNRIFCRFAVQPVHILHK